jgi:hypothetical protein
MNVAHTITLRWFAWSAIAFAIVWLFFGLYASVGVVVFIWVAHRLFRAWKTKKEFEGPGTDLPKRIGQRLTEMIDRPSNRYKRYVDFLKEYPDKLQKYRKILLDQVESACRLAYSVHLSNPERPLMRDCQLSASVLAGMKLARALDIRAAMELKEPLDWEKDKEYLLQIVKKNEGDDGTSTGVLAASSYESASGPVIGYQLYLQAEHDWFEAEMWAYVAYYAGDDNALKWFEDAMPRVAKLSVEYWQKHIASIWEDQKRLRDLVDVIAKTDCASYGDFIVWDKELRSLFRDSKSAEISDKAYGLWDALGETIVTGLRNDGKPDLAKEAEDLIINYKIQYQETRKLKTATIGSRNS